MLFSPWPSMWGGRLACCLKRKQTRILHLRHLISAGSDVKDMKRKASVLLEALKGRQMPEEKDRVHKQETFLLSDDHLTCLSSMFPRMCCWSGRTELRWFFNHMKNHWEEPDLFPWSERRDDYLIFMILWFHGRKDVLLGDTLKSEILQPKIIFTLFNNIEKKTTKKPT